MKYHCLILLFVIPFFVFSCGEECKFNSITSEVLPEGKVGQSYSAQITYDISCSYSLKTFELVSGSGSLPPGIEMAPTGVFSGIPADTGTYNFRVKGRMCFSSNGFEYTDCHDLEKGLTIKIVSQ